MSLKEHLALSFLFVHSLAFSSINDTTRANIDLYYEVINRDTSCVNELTRCYRYFESINDTVWLTRSLIGIAEHENKVGNYGNGFTNLWKALIYAEQKGDIVLQYNIHTILGQLYNIYEQNDEAFFHQQKVLDLAKVGFQQELIKENSIISAYYSFVHSYRKKGDFKIALQYLDSCNYVADKYNYTHDQRVFLHSEKGNVLREQGKLNEALEIFKISEKDFKRVDPDYLTIIYYYLGSTYYSLKEYQSAEKYFKKAVDNIELRPKHYDTKAECLNCLAKSIAYQGRYKEAFTQLTQAKILNDELFSIKGFQNAGILDIRNIYEEEVKERDRIILERDNELMIQKSEILKFRIILIGISAMIVIFVLFLYLRYSRKKFNTEKENQQIKTQLEREKNKALVELKNKELTSFTLRLIDKDSLIKDLVSSIDKYAPENEKLLMSVKRGTTGRLKLWEEFDKRFIDVNKGFYENLKSRFTDLTPTELKHCALIKLNFSAKEMAQLLNISINGVNTSRYRIRKKLKLEREENLTKYIDQI